VKDWPIHITATEHNPESRNDDPLQLDSDCNLRNEVRIARKIDVYATLKVVSVRVSRHSPVVAVAGVGRVVCVDRLTNV
jgi:hypothetical protein